MKTNNIEVYCVLGKHKYLVDKYFYKTKMNYGRHEFNCKEHYLAHIRRKGSFAY